MSYMAGKRTVLKRICEYFFSGVFVALLCLLVLWFINYFKVFNLPTFISEFFDGKTEEPDASYYDRTRFYEFLEESGTSSSTTDFVQLTGENVADMTKTLMSEENYFLEVQCEYFSGKDSVSTLHRIWSSSDKKRVDTIGQNENVTHVLKDGETFILNNYSGESKTIKGDTDFILSDMINIADINKYFEHDKTQVADAKLVESDNDKHLYVKFYTESLDKTDEFFISLEKGVILNAVSLIGEEVVFKQTALEYIPQALHDENIFTTR